MPKLKITKEQNCCDYCIKKKNENNYANMTCYRCGLMSCWRCGKEEGWEEYQASYLGGSTPYLQLCFICHKLVSIQNPLDHIYSLYKLVKEIKEDLDKRYEEWKIRDGEIHQEILKLRGYRGKP